MVRVETAKNPYLVPDAVGFQVDAGRFLILVRDDRSVCACFRPDVWESVLIYPESPNPVPEEENQEAL